MRYRIDLGPALWQHRHDVMRAGGPSDHSIVLGPDPLFRSRAQCRLSQGSIRFWPTLWGGVARRPVMPMTVIVAVLLGGATPLAVPAGMATAHAQTPDRDGGGPQRSEPRIALVIGNSDYRTAPL